MNEASADPRSWIGRRETVEDVITAPPLAALASALDRDQPPPEPGSPMPPLWHWIFFLPRARHSELASDGLAAGAGVVPPIASSGRMFAGVRFDFGKPLRVGETVRREGELVGVQNKRGKSGDLVFVTIRYRYWGSGGRAFTEERDTVFRGSSAPSDTVGKPAAQPRPAHDTAADWRRQIDPDPVLLFRYSALTFNAHRIHYDYRYATEVEGYPDLVVHGPLTATLLAELCRDECADRAVATLECRARGPLFSGAPFTVLGRLDPDGSGCRLAAIDRTGSVAMDGHATFAPS